MHPSKVARIHTSQEWKEDKKKKKRKASAWERNWSAMVFAIMQANKRYTPLYKKPSPANERSKP